MSRVVWFDWPAQKPAPVLEDDAPVTPFRAVQALAPVSETPGFDWEDAEFVAAARCGMASAGAHHDRAFRVVKMSAHGSQLKSRLRGEPDIWLALALRAPYPADCVCVQFLRVDDTWRAWTKADPEYSSPSAFRLISFGPLETPRRGKRSKNEGSEAVHA